MPGTARGYVDDVLAGRVVAGSFVRKAVERHVADLENGAARGLYYDEEAAARPIAFVETFCTHSLGEWAGRPILLEPWQKFILASVFGWRRADGTRRFRTAYTEVAKKNGKSTLSSAVALYLLVADGEPGAEVYTAATTKDQAKIVFDESSRTTKRGHLSRRVRRFRNSLVVEDTASKMEPLVFDADSCDGLNISGAIADEVHRWGSNGQEFYDVIEHSMAARRQPLLFAITTAGQEAESVCGRLHDHGIRVLDRQHTDDALFVFIAALDEGDDWTDPEVWPKANPNLGVSLRVDELRDKIERARGNPAEQNGVRRLRLNEWLAADTRYIALEEWDANRGPFYRMTDDGIPDVPAHELGLAGLLNGAQPSAFGGLDLAASIDLAAFVLAVPPVAQGDPYGVIARLFMPEAQVDDERRARRDRVPYRAWADAGWLCATPGDVIDFGYIRAEIERLGEGFAIEQIGYDPWNATHFATELSDDLGYVMVPIRQGHASMSAPTKEFKRLTSAGKLAHGGHPLMRWMANNLAVKMDEAGNVKPDRKASRQKIDGIVALIMALDRALRNDSGADESAYSHKGLAIL